MGVTRNGARTFLDVIAKACRLSHLPGFRLGLNQILGVEAANSLFAVWTPLCEAVDVLIAADNWYNKFDRANDDGAGEDVTLL